MTDLFDSEVDSALKKWRPDRRGRTCRVEIEDCTIYIYSSPSESFGAAILFYTGPYKFKKWLCRQARLQGYKLTPSGLWRGKVRYAGITEKQIFFCLGVPYLPPEDRDDFRDRGEPFAWKD